MGLLESRWASLTVKNGRVNIVFKGVFMDVFKIYIADIQEGVNNE